MYVLRNDFDFIAEDEQGNFDEEFSYTLSRGTEFNFEYVAENELLVLSSEYGSIIIPPDEVKKVFDIKKL